MFNSEKLIREVRKRKTILLGKAHNRENKSERKRAWYQVAEAMTKNDDWKKYNATRKYECAMYMQKKWKHLRDYYVRVKRTPGLSRTGVFELLLWMDNEPTAPAKKKDEEDDASEEAEVENTCSPAPPCHSPPQCPSPPPQPIQEEYIHIEDINASTSRNAPNPSSGTMEESNRYFLLSLLQYMQNMSDDQNFMFRMQVMEIINKVRYGNSDPFSYIHLVRKSE